MNIYKQAGAKLCQAQDKFGLLRLKLIYVFWPSSLHRHMSPILFSIILLIRLASNDTPKISFLACLILDVALKKTLKFGFGIRPQFFHNISSNLVRIKLHTKNQSPSLLNFGDCYEENRKIWIWKTTSKKFPIFLNNSSSLVRIKLHTNNQPPSLLNF